jgi:hypothetical protein
MKKLLVLLIVALAFFGFSASASAQLLDVCSACKSCPVTQISCGEQSSCIPFKPCDKYVFSICNCLTAATSFVSGHRIGVRMTILVNGVPGQNGAYWADPNSANVPFSMYGTTAAACAGTTFNRTFGPGQFYKTAANGTAITTLPLPVPIAGSTCKVDPANQATMIVTNPENGYTITDTDELNKLSRWWINIPDIRIDKTVITTASTISIKIETLDQNTGGICADCVATCECTIVVATVCAVSQDNKCTFPYFTSASAATTSNSWWNAIVLTNTSSSAGTVTLNVYQIDGATATFTTPSIPAHSQFVSPLENISFTGTGLGGQAIYIQATSTFAGLDGYAFMADAHGNSMGYLCRKP